jgi:hypothetical protein
MQSEVFWKMGLQVPLMFQMMLHRTRCDKVLGCRALGSRILGFMVPGIHDIDLLVILVYINI